MLLMIVSIMACNKTTSGDDGSGSASPSSPASSNPSSGGTDSGPAGSEDTSSGDTYGSDQTLASGFGLFREDFDYSTMPRYSVVGMYNEMNGMFMDIDYYLKIWAERTNCDYTTYDAGKDSDAFITAIDTYANQGVDGVIINPDAAVIPRVVEVLDEGGMKYFAGFSPAIHNDNSYAHPYVGTDNYEIGYTLGSWLADYADTIEGFDLSKAAVLWMDWSTSNEVHLRGIGVWYAWDDHFGNAADAFHYVDGVSEGAMTEEVGYNFMSTQIVSNKDIEFWFVATTMESFSFGAARALEDYGLDKTSACCNNGADSLILQWDQGSQTCFRAANAFQNGIRTNAYFNGLYAFMAGWATPESIWPDCTPEGKDYAYVILRPHMVDFNTYKEYYAWGDYVVGDNKHGYEYDGKTTFTPYTITNEYPLLWTEVTYDPTNGQLTKE
jgi:hypothetical protein